MRANSLRFLIVGALISASSAASAQGLPPPSANTGQGSGMPTNSPPPAEAPPLIPTTGDVLPPPVAGGPSGAEASNGAAAPAAAAAPAPKPSDWHFSWRGFLRAPLRIGVGHRPQCPPGTAAATTNTATSSNGVAYGAQYCALNGQSRTTYHSPYVPDDQYLSWTFDGQWEQAWAEMFLSYGNDKVTGTVSVQGYDFTDVSLLGSISNPAQFGIGQGWVAITPTCPSTGCERSFASAPSGRSSVWPANTTAATTTRTCSGARTRWVSRSRSNTTLATSRSRPSTGSGRTSRWCRRASRAAARPRRSVTTTARP